MSKFNFSLFSRPTSLPTPDNAAAATGAAPAAAQAPGPSAPKQHSRRRMLNERVRANLRFKLAVEHDADAPEPQSSAEKPVDRCVGLGGAGFALCDGKVSVADPETGESSFPVGGLENVKRLKFNPNLGLDYSAYALTRDGEVVALGADGRRQDLPADKALPGIPMSAQDFAVATDRAVYYLTGAGEIWRQPKAGAEARIPSTGIDGYPESIALDYANRAWAAGPGQVWRERAADEDGDEGGVHWEAIGAPPGVREFRLRTLIDGTVVADAGAGKMLQYSDRAGTWKPVAPEREATRAFDQLYELLRGPRAATEFAVGPFGTHIGHANLRNAPWWKPSVFQRSRPDEKLRERWGNYWKAHYALHSTRASGDERHMVDDIRRTAREDLQFLRSMPPCPPDALARLAQASEAVNRNAHTALDTLLHRLGITIYDEAATLGDDPNVERQPAYRAVGKAAPAMVRSPDNVLYAVRQTRVRMFGEDEVTRKIDKLLDLNVFLPLEGRRVVTGANRMPHVIKNKYEALTSQLVLDHARLLKAAAAIDALPRESYAHGVIGQIADRAASETVNHELTQLRDHTFSNLDRAERVVRGMDRIAAGLREPDSKLNRALSLQGELSEDIVDLYVRAALDMDCEARIVLRGRWAANAGTVGAVSLLLKKFGIRPEVSLHVGPEFLMDIHKKDSCTWIKFAVRDKSAVNAGARFGVRAEVPMNDSSALYGGLEASAVPEYEKIRDNRIYVTIMNQPPDKLRKALEALLKGDFSALGVLRAADRNDNDRREIHVGRLNLSATAGGQMRVAGTRGLRTRVGPLAQASATLLQASKDDRRRFGPEMSSYDVQVRQFSAVQHAAAGATLAMSEAATQTAHLSGGGQPGESGRSARFVAALSALRLGAEKYWDRIAGPEVEQEIKYTEHGTYEAAGTEVLLFKLGDIQAYPDIRNVLELRPELEDRIKALQRHGKPVTLVYQLSAEAERRIRAYDPATDGVYKEYVARICHDRANWAIQEIMVRHAKAYHTSATLPIPAPLTFSSSAEVELHSIHGRIKFNYADGALDPDRPYELDVRWGQFIERPQTGSVPDPGAAAGQAAGAETALADGSGTTSPEILDWFGSAADPDLWDGRPSLALTDPAASPSGAEEAPQPGPASPGPGRAGS